MPYKNSKYPPSYWKKWDSCVKKVKKKSTKGKVNPYAVCHASIKKGGKGSIRKKSVKRSRKKRVIRTGPRGGRYYISGGKKVYV